jgi:hypothetical protein
MDTTKELDRLCELYISMVQAYRNSAKLEENHADHIGYFKGMLECLLSDMEDLGYVQKDKNPGRPFLP